MRNKKTTKGKQRKNNKKPKRNRNHTSSISSNGNYFTNPSWSNPKHSPRRKRTNPLSPTSIKSNEASNSRRTKNYGFNVINGK